jgi:uncharacterized protein (TIGR03118 family)
MKKINSSFTLPLFFYRILFLFCLFSSCKKGQDTQANTAEIKSSNEKSFKNFEQVNLVANVPGYGAGTRIDPSLINAWGIAFTPTGSTWVTSQGGHVSEVYTSEGAQGLPAVNIPSPTNLNGSGNPTGIILNPNATDFIIPSGNTAPQTGARFIFVGLDGVVAAWNGTWGNLSFRKFDRSSTSAYTGLALANNGGSNFLYAANFRTGKINVWNASWAPVSMSFTDPDLPVGYAPFNIQNIGNKLYIMYAKVAASGKNDAGEGKGFVSIFNPDGSFVKRFASEGKLNSPWGIALAPASLFKNDDHGDDSKGYVLVGNFGDGRINVYRTSDGKFKGQLGTPKNPITIEGLWAISFPPATSTIDPNRLYFAAGPHEEAHGLFGYVKLNDNKD